MSLCQTCETYLYLQTYLPLCQTCKLFRCCIFVLFFISTTFSLCPPLVVCKYTLFNVLRWDYFPCLSRLMPPSIFGIFCNCSKSKCTVHCNTNPTLLYAFLLNLSNIAVIIAEWQEWGEWSQCSTSCGNGSRVRGRGCLGDPFGGNQQCPGNPTEVEECNTSECPGIPLCIISLNTSGMFRQNV